MKVPACPECGSKQLTLIGKRNALYPAGYLVVFHILFAMLHRLQSPIEFRCDACGKHLSQRYFAERFALPAFIGVIFGRFGLIVYLCWTEIQTFRIEIKGSGDNFLHHPPVHVRQPELATLIAEGQALVIDA